MSEERGRGNLLGRLTALVVLVGTAAYVGHLACGARMCPLGAGRSCPFMSRPAPAGSVLSVPPVRGAR